MDDTSRHSAHLVGACGAGMKALAEVLLDLNWRLTGSDLIAANPSIQKLMQQGLIFQQGHREANLPPLVSQLIYSPAIPMHNCERIEATRRGLPQFSYSQMVGRLMSQSKGVCIAGTHGKSTTTAMTASILDAAGRLQAAVMGAEMRDGGRSGWTGPGDLFVAESCEFQRSFLDFKPQNTLVLSIETDHVDCFPDLKSLKSAFLDFASSTADDGVLVTNADCSISRQVAWEARTDAKRVTFGSERSADWTIGNFEPTSTGSRFQLVHQGKLFSPIELLVYGRHNAMNSLAAAAICSEIGVAAKTIRESLARFHGIRRRFEFVGEWNGVTMIDDYAHHPTAVKTTLKTLRQIAGNRVVRCVFQPHQISRTTALIDDFSTSFAEVDEVLIAPVFAARESVVNEPILVAAELARRLRLHGVPAQSFSSLDQIVRTLEDASCPGDIIVTMGAGDIDRIHHEFTRRVPNNSSAG